MTDYIQLARDAYKKLKSTSVPQTVAGNVRDCLIRADADFSALDKNGIRSHDDMHAEFRRTVKEACIRCSVAKYKDLVDEARWHYETVTPSKMLDDINEWLRYAERDYDILDPKEPVTNIVQKIKKVVGKFLTSEQSILLKDSLTRYRQKIAEKEKIDKLKEAEAALHQSRRGAGRQAQRHRLDALKQKVGSRGAAAIRAAENARREELGIPLLPSPTAPLTEPTDEAPVPPPCQPEGPVSRDSLMVRATGLEEALP